MANHPKYQLEATEIGLQYVIPGAERVPVARPAEEARPAYTADGDQLVIPGAEQISTRELMERKVAGLMKPRLGQRGLAGTALFGKHK